ncbi:CbiX/SirB N-terminal domain-containing protein [Poseidonibacter lekithochrous]|uniref:CbiX/SirB N-terminal domain-containing protein n=1 Tax=Poseidonibacter TaxID=2321187 RepID=UPI001C087D55|nr:MULTISPECIES: CbiX/SirB N-terminal domain-containing protein [Poseidonibacter]MBU3013141.1 CbiX/SirB N-terminal domain-containing protein [Poseidonibacter lekithochrous]MDO6826437.1 CbiX/SirB N-terminal domain-containing protein [Poseidonibacter sp. 1_MG-2023]
MNALVLIAHGSKKSLSNEEFVALGNEIRNKDKKFNKVETAFLELATPSIQTVANNLILNKISKIYFYPYFLNSGKHVGVDLPYIINQLKEENPLVEFTLLKHFGKSDRISDIIIDDVSLSL